MKHGDGIIVGDSNTYIGPLVGEPSVPRNIELINPVPEWAAWLAQDADGAWFVYEEQPEPEHGEWQSARWIETSAHGELRIVAEGEPNSNWRNTLVNLREV